MMHAMRRGDDLEWLRDPERCILLGARVILDKKDALSEP